MKRELALGDLLRKLNPSNHDRGVVKTFEAQHRPGPAFDAAMTLFDHVIEVLTIAQERIGWDLPGLRGAPQPPDARLGSRPG